MVRKISIEEWEKTRKDRDVREKPVRVEGVSRKWRYEQAGKKDQDFGDYKYFGLEALNSDTVDWKALRPKLLPAIVRGMFIGLLVAFLLDWAYLPTMIWGALIAGAYKIFRLGVFKEISK